MPIRRLSLTVVLVALAACASGGQGTRVTPPKLIGNDHPTLVSSGRPVPMQLVLSVMIDPNGSADISTLRIKGTENAEQRSAVVEWLTRNRFTPAMSDGIPVRGEFSLDMRTKVVTTRVAR